MPTSSEVKGHLPDSSLTNFTVIFSASFCLCAPVGVKSSRTPTQTRGRTWKWLEIKGEFKEKNSCDLVHRWILREGDGLVPLTHREREQKNSMSTELKCHDKHGIRVVGGNQWHSQEGTDGKFLFLFLSPTNMNISVVLNTGWAIYENRISWEFSSF